MKTVNTKVVISVLVFSLITTLTHTACASVESHVAMASDFNQVGNANFSVKGSEIDANTGNGFLVTKQRYSDFYLKVEFSAGTGTNSGIFFRCQDPEQISDKSCYEANIFDTRPDQTFRTGAVTGYAAPKTIINAEDGKLHIYEVIVAGDKIRVLLDGKETVYMRNQSLSSGYVALQLAHGEIKFRNLEIKPLNGDVLNTTETVLDGVWELESMDIVDASGKATPWCPGSFGVIMYSKNYMSTAVNCTSDSTKSVLYSGPFEIIGQSVYHHAQNHSAANLNKVHSRDFKLGDQNHLVLSGDLGNSSVIVKWVRK